jgi:hypothetical protein
MRIHGLLLRALLALAAIISGVLGTAAPAMAQKDVTPATVARVRGNLDGASRPGVTFVKYREKAWFMGIDGGGSNEDLVEDSRDATSVTLTQGPRPAVGVQTGPRYVLNLANKVISGAFITKSGQGYAAVPISGTITEVSADTCRSRTASSANCVCDLRWLRPLQGAVGLGEVMDKRNKIKDPDKLAKEKADLQKDPIKVVVGPDSALYVVDHHHGARAWLEADYTAGVCQYLLQPAISPEPPQFWAQLDAQHWVHLKDKDGVAIRPDALPKTLLEMPDDPYRTLAWMVRKRDGYCRSLMTQGTAFAEFQWADWMRQRTDKLSLASVKAATDKGLWDRRKRDREAVQKPVLDEAVALAMSDAAKDLPGYRGNRAVANCNPSGGE